MGGEGRGREGKGKEGKVLIEVKEGEGRKDGEGKDGRGMRGMRGMEKRKR